jgi:uncharacterized membrane protein
MSQMSGVAEHSRTAGWRPRLVWIALALSLTLNVFFIGGLTWMKVTGHPPPPPIERIERIGQGLNLNDDQRIAFEQFIRVIRQRGRFIRDSNQPLLERMWAELAKPQPDNDSVVKLGAQISQNRQVFLKEASDAFFDFVKTLSPEQRAQLSTIARRANDPATRRLFEVIAP